MERSGVASAGLPAYRAQAVERAVELAPMLRELRAAGLSTRAMIGPRPRA